MGAGVEFTTEISRGSTTYQAYPEEIKIDPELNGRHEDSSVENLAADIEANGQHEPVICRKNDQGEPVLTVGHRRYRAICLLNERNPKSRRKINFLYKRMSDTEAFITAIGENRFRKDVSPIDDAANIEILRRRFNFGDADIAKIYFPEAQTEEEKKAALRFVKERSSLIELAPEAAQAVRDGRMKVTAAVALSKLSRDQQKKKVANSGKIATKDVKPAKPIKAKPQQRDAELMKRIGAMLEDVEGLLEDTTAQYIEVERVLLLNLSNYYKELRP